MADWLWGLIGMAAGALSILWLRLSLSRLGRQAAGSAGLGIAGGIILRLLLIGCLLFLAVQQGLAQVLYAFAGFWLIRWPLLIWANRGSWPFRIAQRASQAVTPSSEAEGVMHE